MFTSRLALVAAVAFGTALLPASGADAASSTPDAVGTLAHDAAQVVAEEQELIALDNPDTPLSPSDRAEARSRLRMVDAQGSEMLLQFDAMGVELTGAIRATMERLPEPSPTSQGIGPVPPPPVVYDAAVTDLLRIASTPDAVVTVTTDDGTGTSLGLLAVAAAALIALGLAAVSSTIRRRGETLEAMAWSDGLTGVGNRRRLDRDLAAHQLDDCQATAVIMVDIDHFKLVNDRHGHQAGDDVLRKVGSLLAAQVRHDDVVYRYGGEEFCVLLPGATRTEAQAVADRIVSGARSITLPDGNNVTVSVGVADGAPDELPVTLETADRALFAAKAGGRDRSHPASDDTLQPA